VRIELILIKTDYNISSNMCLLLAMVVKNGTLIENSLEVILAIGGFYYFPNQEQRNKKKYNQTSEHLMIDTR